MPSKIRLIAKREYLARIQQRSFRIGTIVQMVILVAIACVPTIIQAFQDDDPVAETTVTVVDTSGADVTPRLTAALARSSDEAPPDIALPVAGAGQAVRVTLEATDQSAAEVRALVNDGDAAALLIVARNDVGELTFAYETEEGDDDAAARAVLSAAATVSFQDRLERAGVGRDQFEQVAAPPVFTVGATQASDAAVDSEDQEFARTALAYILSIMMYSAVMLYGLWVAQGVAEEKSNRIIEVIINAAPPRELMAGKILGIGAAALTQLVPTFAVAGVALVLQGRLAEALFNERSGLAALDLSALSLRAGAAFLIFFLLGFLLYAALYAAAGSLVSRQEEVNQVSAPMTLVILVGFFGSFFALGDADGLVARVLSLVPLTSPTVMLTRIIVGDPPAGEVGLSVLLLVAAVVLAVLLAARIYRVGVLLYGSRPRLRALLSSGQTTAAR